LDLENLEAQDLHHLLALVDLWDLGHLEYQLNLEDLCLLEDLEDLYHLVVLLLENL
jgi:hypothetical protein